MLRGERAPHAARETRLLIGRAVLVVFLVRVVPGQFLFGHAYDPRMIGIRSATASVEQSANAVTELANSVKDELYELSEQVRTGARMAPFLVIGTAGIAIAALILSVVALTRRP